uniref:CutA divalent cation tolerance homolog n=1 Tax=Serinus canaria TaxID=9135 RepID=A0A8C9L014_SERCA
MEAKVINGLRAPGTALGGASPPTSPGLLSEVLTLLLLLLHPLLWGLALQLHSALTGSYIPGTHSVAFVTCLNEHIARDIARYGPAAPAWLLQYFWKGELEESTEILLVSGHSLHHKNPWSCKGSIHPFEIPEIISLPIDQGNPAYLQWMEENVPRR